MNVFGRFVRQFSKLFTVNTRALNEDNCVPGPGKVLLSITFQAFISKNGISYLISSIALIHNNPYNSYNILMCSYDNKDAHLCLNWKSCTLVYVYLVYRS